MNKIHVSLLAAILVPAGLMGANDDGYLTQAWDGAKAVAGITVKIPVGIIRGSSSMDRTALSNTPWAVQAITRTGLVVEGALDSTLGERAPEFNSVMDHGTFYALSTKWALVNRLINVLPARVSNNFATKFASSVISEEEFDLVATTGIARGLRAAVTSFLVLKGTNLGKRFYNTVVNGCDLQERIDAAVEALPAQVKSERTMAIAKGLTYALACSWVNNGPMAPISKYAGLLQGSLNDAYKKSTFSFGSSTKQVKNEKQ